MGGWTTTDQRIKFRKQNLPAIRSRQHCLEADALASQPMRALEREEYGDSAAANTTPVLKVIAGRSVTR
jgi:hypothetical protein